MENKMTGWRVGNAGFTVFGPKAKADAPAPRILLTGRDRDVVRLAAAAPELLAALRFIIQQSNLEPEMKKAAHFMGNALADARAAIAKAEGR